MVANFVGAVAECLPHLEGWRPRDRRRSSNMAPYRRAAQDAPRLRLHDAGAGVDPGIRAQSQRYARLATAPSGGIAAAALRPDPRGSPAHRPRHLGRRSSRLRGVAAIARLGVFRARVESWRGGLAWLTWCGVARQGPGANGGSDARRRGAPKGRTFRGGSRFRSLAIPSSGM